jgi:hypothetical protein
MDLVSVFCMQIPFFPATFVKEAVFSPSYVFGAFVKNQEGIAVWIHIWSSCLFLCQYHDVFIAMAL